MSHGHNDGDHESMGHQRTEARAEQHRTSLGSSSAPSASSPTQNESVQQKPQRRPANNMMGPSLQPSSSAASRTASGTPSTSNSHTTYESFPSQSSSPTPSMASLQPYPQTDSNIQSHAGNARPTEAPKGIRGYQNITSVEPAPKRSLWSLGSTLPRVRRLPAKPTKTAYPTPGSRSNFVQQPLAAASTIDPQQQLHDDAGEPVRRRDFADTKKDQSHSAEDRVREADEPDSQELRQTMSASKDGGDSELPPIEEGKPLPREYLPERPSGRQDRQKRPVPISSLSSPSVPASSQPPLSIDQKVDRTEGKDHGMTEEEHTSPLSDPQQRLSAARKQLLEEADDATGQLAIQGSAVDANDYEDDKDIDFDDKSGLASPGIASHPKSKHVKTSSMPFLPSQGFDVLVAAPSHKGADQLNQEAKTQARSRADSQTRSAMDQTRHPGLSGARPAPRGRTAGGPAAGVGVRKPSTQSKRRESDLGDVDPSSTGYFDASLSSHELSHLDRQGSMRTCRDSQQSHRVDQGANADHITARPVGGRIDSHSSSKSQNTRTLWLKRNMPSHCSYQKTDEGDVAEGKQELSQRSEEDAGMQVSTNDKTAQRHSEETAYSSSSAHDIGDGEQELDSKEATAEDDDLWLGGQGTLPDGSIAFPTTWSRWRYHSREFLAELVATMLLLTVGTAVDCQVTLSQAMGSSAGAYPNQNWAWGFAVASTIYLSGGRSGAHCNPAITLSLAVFRGFPWIQVPIYWTAQLLGSLLGAAITYGIYLPVINAYEGGPGIRTLAGDHGTGRLFVTVPQLVFTAASGFGTEVVATSILMAMVLAVGDETNAPPSDGLSALVLGFVVVMIGMSFGWPTSYAISPSRDLGPRLFLYMVGYGKELWTHNSYWWIYGPQCGCFVGGLVGALLYDLAIFTGEESPINYTRQGWRQSTSARVGSRLLNSVERTKFWTMPLRHPRHGMGGQGNDGEIASNEGSGSEIYPGGLDQANYEQPDGVTKMPSGLARQDLDSLRGFEKDGRKASSLGASGEHRRRRSHASQVLDAQEEGRSSSGV